MKIAALMELAGSQYGCVTLHQALEVMTRSQVNHLIATQVLLRVHPATYIVRGIPLSWQQRAMAAVLSVPGAVLSHCSAGRLWGLKIFPSEEIHITVPPDASTRRIGVTVHRSNQLDGFTDTYAGIAITSSARTLVDLSSCLSVSQLGAALDQACHLKLVKLDHISNCLTEMTTVGRSRISILRKLLAQRDATDERVESFLERRVLRWIRNTALPDPVSQHWVSVGSKNYRLDFAYPKLKVAIEVDGPHHLLASIAEEDRVRNTNLAFAGWFILHVGTNTSSEEFIPALIEALRRAK